METLEYTTYDKTKWPRRGQWDSEPDKKQWQDEATGLPCLIVRSSGGHLCGYVGVPESHPLHGKSYSHRIDVPDRNAVKVNPSAVIPLFVEACREDDGKVSLDCLIDVHGGLTFADACSPGADEAKGICHKPSDGEPDSVWWFGFDCAHCDDVSPAWSHQSGEYRDWQYVEHETRKLAAQLAALA